MSDRMKELQRSWRAFSRSADPAAVSPDARIGFAGSFTVDPLLPYLGAVLLESGFKRPEMRNANYNQVVRTCLDPASELGGDPLDTIVLLWRLEDLGDPSDVAGLQASRGMLLDAVARLRETFAGTIVLALPPRPRPFAEGIVEFARPSALTALWFDTLSRVEALAQSLPNVFTLDLEGIVAACGEAAALDHRKELLYRQPYTDNFYVACAEALSRLYRARRLEPKKCIVVDCDNTIWGGVIGEDGVGGVELSDDMPGRAFREFQRQLSALRKSGVFLALNSKNNPDDVWQMFDEHDGMVLKRQDVSVAKVNWRPKSENLKEIAQELNIGLDALVFIDDSHFEVEEVRTHAPEVTVFQVPEDIGDLPLVMRQASRLFDRLTITADDRARVDMMRQEMERRDLSQKMTEAEFLGSLGLEIALYPPSETDLARVTQLINKTNQFNVTTRRYSFEEVAALVSGADTDVYCATVKDRFGDYGLVGIGIVKHNGKASEFDTLLMSCRVLGRGIETAMISHALSLAAARNSGEMLGRYIPTKKNGMVADLFQRHDFARDDTAASAEAGSLWRRATSQLAVPDFLSVRLGRSA